MFNTTKYALRIRTYNLKFLFFFVSIYVILYELYTVHVVFNLSFSGQVVPCLKLCFKHVSTWNHLNSFNKLKHAFPNVIKNYVESLDLKFRVYSLNVKIHTTKKIRH